MRKAKSVQPLPLRQLHGPDTAKPTEDSATTCIACECPDFTKDSWLCDNDRLLAKIQVTHVDESNTIASLAPGTSPDTAAVGSRLTFFRQWLRNPLRMSSITPSGRQLADMMATAVPDDGHGVIELGAGTGAITRALIERGIDPQHLLVVEMNAVLHDMLQRMFPRTHVVQGDARQLTRLVAEAGTFGEKPVDAIVSSLGLLAMPQAVQHDILAAAFSVMPADGVFIQYTYGPSLPVAQEVCTALGLRCRKQGWAWRNLPPARVFVYSRQ